MLDFLLHFESYLPGLIESYGVWIYALVWVIVFCETGLVVTPFLPGDSMLFALGAFAAQGSLHIGWLFGGLVLAAIAGDSLNYLIGKYLGQSILNNPHQKLFKPEHYRKAHEFYEKWGGKAIVLSRFVPIVRTFAPFVAGVGKMHYHKFIAYNVVGGVLWVSLFLGLGYGLGNLEWVKGNFKAIAIGIIVLSLVPIVWEIAAAKMSKKSPAVPASSAGDKKEPELVTADR
jgi:membrane-associated protein